MIQFITWPKTIDVKFRAAYLAETGEKIQNTPLESSDGLYYLVGSSRATSAHLANLAAIHTEMETNKGSEPASWVLAISE